MIDTHCHLTFPDFKGRADAVLADAASHGVSGCITISTTSADCLDALEIARAHDRAWCSAGVHPLYADRDPRLWHNILAAARDPKCVAWGELGLDNHYPTPAPDIQRPVLLHQLTLIADARASGINLPVILHCREAFDDLIPILKASTLDTSRMVFHCFTGTPDNARACLDLGAMISFTGVVTYRNAKDVQDAARLVPADRIMVETDAPFLSPEPHRGRRPCEPWMTSLTARFLADLRAVPFDDFHTQLNLNTSRFFNIHAL
ncbi:MAG: TatD family hydrolase [Phycisphaeraceae bacterium]|nr:MAG: TatD family hydrolase [Phycisphaeraceae bacterium]